MAFKNTFGKALWKALGEKGKLATIIGTLHIVPAQIYFVYMLVTKGFVGMEYEALQNIMSIYGVINLIGILWYILPSKISIKGSKFEVIIED